MFPAFLLSLREGLEAGLIIGILLGTLQQIRRNDLRPAIWQGFLAALLVALAAGGALYALSLPLEEEAEEIYEGVTMLLAAGVLTWMIFWMRRHAPFLKESLAAKVHDSALTGGHLPLFLVAFFAVAREGLELALFLTATTLADGLSSTLIGALLGLIAAAALGWGLFASLLRLDLRRFFVITSLLLTLFAAGMVAHGVHEFVELSWIPAMLDPVWDTNLWLPERSFPGYLLTALFGYNGNPSLTEVLAYWGYLLITLFSSFRLMKWQELATGQP